MRGSLPAAGLPAALTRLRALQVRLELLDLPLQTAEEEVRREPEDGGDDETSLVPAEVEDLGEIEDLVRGRSRGSRRAPARRNQRGEDRREDDAADRGQPREERRVDQPCDAEAEVVLERRVRRGSAELAAEADEAADEVEARGGDDLLWLRTRDDRDDEQDVAGQAGEDDGRVEVVPRADEPLAAAVPILVDGQPHLAQQAAGLVAYGSRSRRPERTRGPCRQVARRSGARLRRSASGPGGARVHRRDPAPRVVAEEGG